MDRSGKTRSRHQRMDNPRTNPIGRVTIGQRGRWCNTCRKEKNEDAFILVNVDGNPKECPNCNDTLGNVTTGKLNYFRFADFPAGLQTKLHEKYGPKPPVVPFLFPVHPAACATVGREYYKGSTRFCYTTRVFNQMTLSWEHTDRATRQGQAAMVVCDPLTCEFCEGDNPPCKEKLTLYMLLYELEGLGLARFKTGGIHTIENFLNDVPVWLQMLKNQWKMLKLELRLGLKPAKYWNAKRQQFEKTTIIQVFFHLPVALAEIAGSDAILQIEPGEEVKALPAVGTENYDPLIDNPVKDHTPDPGLKESKPLSDLKGRETPSFPQAKPVVDDATLKRLQDLMLALAGGPRSKKHDRNKVGKRVRQAFSVVKGLKWVNISQEKAVRIIAYLQVLKDGDQDAASWLEQDNYIDEKPEDIDLTEDTQLQLED